MSTCFLISRPICIVLSALKTCITSLLYNLFFIFLFFGCVKKHLFLGLAVFVILVTIVKGVCPRLLSLFSLSHSQSTGFVDFLSLYHIVKVQSDKKVNQTSTMTMTCQKTYKISPLIQSCFNFPAFFNQQKIHKEFFF